jgi:hypothetical protein
MAISIMVAVASVVFNFVVIVGMLLLLGTSWQALALVLYKSPDSHGQRTTC